MTKHIAASVLALGAILLVPAVAQAKDHPAHGSAAALVGFGFDDWANFGLGARAGYTFRQNFYIGGLLQYHFGESNDAGAFGVTGDAHRNIYYFGVEGGYDFVVDSVTIRPYIGLGPGFKHASGEGCAPIVGCTKVSDTDTEFTFWLGGNVVYNFDNDWFLGGDFRLPILDGDVYASLFATGGLYF